MAVRGLPQCCGQPKNRNQLAHHDQELGVDMATDDNHKKSEKERFVTSEDHTDPASSVGFMKTGTRS